MTEETTKPETKKKRRPRQPKVGAYIVQRKIEGGWLDLGEAHTGLRSAKDWLETYGEKGMTYRIASVSESWTIEQVVRNTLKPADTPQ